MKRIQWQRRTDVDATKIHYRLRCPGTNDIIRVCFIMRPTIRISIQIMGKQPFLHCVACTKWVRIYCRINELSKQSVFLLAWSLHFAHSFKFFIIRCERKIVSHARTQVHVAHRVAIIQMRKVNWSDSHRDHSSIFVRSECRIRSAFANEPHSFETEIDHVIYFG